MASAVIVIVVAVATGVLLYTSTFEPATEPLKVFTTDWAPYGFAYVAQEKGIFEKNQIDVELKLLDESESLILFPQGFTADGSLEVLTDVIFINVRHISSQFVYVIDESGNADVVVSKTDSIKELQGKTIGIWEFGGFSHIFLLELLENNGINSNDVVFREVIPDEIVDALNDGLIDAGHTFNEENIQLAKSSGYKIIATERDTPGLITDGIMFKTQVIRDRHDDVLSFVKSFKEAQEYCELNFDECVDIIAQEYGWDKSLVSEGLTSVDIKNFEDNLKLFNNKESPLYESGEFIIQKLREINQIPYSPEINEIINSDFVNELAGSQNP